MDTEDYKKNRAECWKEYCQTHPLCNTPVMRLNFDRAFALGKQEKDAEKKSIALRKAWYLYRYGEMHDPDDWTRDTVKPSDNFECGFNAGYTACEQSMWRSVEEELPSNYADVLASDENGLHIASYFNGEWYSCDDEFTRNPQMWMSIPSISDKNTEKKMNTLFPDLPTPQPKHPDKFCRTCKHRCDGKCRLTPAFMQTDKELALNVWCRGICPDFTPKSKISVVK